MNNQQGNVNTFNKENNNKKGKAPSATVLQSNQNKYTSNKQNTPIRPLSSSSRITSTHHHHNKDMAQFEEEINITVPTPYPKAQFMTIDDPILQSSSYTTSLNQKYPPRQYLKHNQQSWNKIVKPKSSDIKFSFINPKLNFSDYNLKAITYKNEEIGKAKLTNIEDAQELVDKLKAKLIEYELTNNSNISQANEMLANYKQLIETYKAQLNDLYSKLEYIEEKYGIDIEYLNEVNPYNVIVKGFRRRWLIQTFMKAFVNRITRQKIIKHQYNRNVNKKMVLFKLKAFISLEKHHALNSFARNFRAKKTMNTIKGILYAFSKNKYINKLQRQFGLVQQNMSQLLYLKELKLRICKKRNYQSKNHKALLFYYRKGVSKAIKALNRHCINQRNNNTNANVNMEGNDKQIQSSKVNYTKFASSLGKMDKTQKESKMKGMNVMKSLVNRMTGVNKQKISNANNNTVILIHYFREWVRGAKENKKIMEYNMITKHNMLNSFYQSALKSYRLSHYTLLSNNSNVIKSNAKTFFTTIKHNLKFKSNCNTIKQRIPMLIKRNVINILQSIVIDSPTMHFKRIKKRLLFSNFIDSLRNNVKSIKSLYQINQSWNIFQAKSPMIYAKAFYSFAKKHILLINSKSRKVNSLIAKYLQSKALHALLVKAFATKQLDLRNYYENTISNIKTIITEKSGIINKLEYDNKDLAIHFEESQDNIQTTASENKLLRQTLYDRQYQYENELRKYRELIEQNASDVRSLQMTIQNNENLLSQAIAREEQLQNKYVNDIQNVVKLNKNLNDIITKKNQQLLDVNLIKRKEAEEEQIEKQMRSKRNNDLVNNLTLAIKQKEYEKITLEEEKNKKIHQSSVLLEHYQKEKQMVDYKNTQLIKENKILLSKMQQQQVSQGY